MSDYSELKRLAEAANENYPGWYSLDQLSFRAVDEAEFVVAANPSAVLALIAENEDMAEFKDHMASLRETHGYDSWASVLVEVDQLKAENKRLAALLECAQGDLKQAMQIIEKDQPLPPGCWEWVVPKGTKAPCRACSGFGTIETGIDEAPSTICSACNGTGEES